MTPTPAQPGRQAVRQEMEQARQAFHDLLDHPTVADLRRPSHGTRWTNEQLLFHMLFGYLVVRALLILARAYGRLPDRASAALARLLDAARTPFDVINYWGSRLGARITPASRMEARFDRVIAALERHLDQEPDSALREHGHGRLGPDIVVVFDGSRRLRSLPGAVGILREGPPAGVYRPAAPVAPVAGPRTP